MKHVCQTAMHRFTEGKRTLSRLKNIDGYVGRGCVHWDGKHDHRPYKCIIEEVHAHTIHRKKPHGGVDKKENIEFVIYNPRLHQRFTVENIELFDNFRECYRCICEYSSFKSLCELGRYSPSLEANARSRMTSCLRNFAELVDDENKTSQKYGFAEYKQKIVETCNLVAQEVNETSVDIDYQSLLCGTLYGFIMEMMKRYPNMDATRAHRMSEISFEENGK